MSGECNAYAEIRLFHLFAARHVAAPSARRRHVIAAAAAE
jgi:hypothetical protein